MTTRIPDMSRSCNAMPGSDLLVVGAGIIGLALALELNDRGASVTVIERGKSLGESSFAAAGMLAVHDPHNPPEVRSLSEWSAGLYPGFLERIERLSGVAVPFQTEATMQHLRDGTMIRLAEKSLEPRQLGLALLVALKRTSVRLLEQTQMASVRNGVGGVDVKTVSGMELGARALVYATGAWTSEAMSGLCGEVVPMAPRKGQMLRVRLPAALALKEVHRGERIYVVPRSRGEQAGTALIGATVEDVGFDYAVRAEDLVQLRALAAEMLPELGSEADAPLVESWAGLRPATPDGLPCIGACGGANYFVASGHYRNGILQAPGTADVLADLLEGKTPKVDLSAFSPGRFASSEKMAGHLSAHA